ncbi:PD-(D/E)XK nuclease family protein [Burkholderia mayonis]|uniref:PD-(D/E)XK nuclease family protein n=1 Tax=Burkholderia mayonis TaxID=1385591 RepID=UPI00131EEFC4|nr:PD-(D/E)XK nuclease family protein [Burkholderia mayonis]
MLSHGRHLLFQRIGVHGNGSPPVWRISIENKLKGAGDQAGQVSDYLTDLDKRGGGTNIIVYLTALADQLPAEHSISRSDWQGAEASGRALAASAASLVAWLDATINRVQAPNVQQFLRDFRQYLKEKVLGESSDQVAEIVLRHADDADGLAAALQVIRSREALYSRLKTKAMADIDTLLPAGWIICRRLDTQYGIGIRLPDTAHWHMCIEPQSGEHKAWIWGIKREDRSYDDVERDQLARIGSSLRKRLDANGKPSDWWPYHLPFRGTYAEARDPASYRDWEVNVEPWLDMQSGRFARRIIDLFESIATALQTPHMRGS